MTERKELVANFHPTQQFTRWESRYEQLKGIKIEHVLRHSSRSLISSVLNFRLVKDKEVSSYHHENCSISPAIEIHRACSIRNGEWGNETQLSVVVRKTKCPPSLSQLSKEFNSCGKIERSFAEKLTIDRREVSINLSTIYLLSFLIKNILFYLEFDIFQDVSRFQAL